MKLERIIKKVYEPIRTGGWEVRFILPQDIEEQIAARRNTYFETVEYV